ncbi:hypothetical protein [Streptomyces sp. RK9]|uniref:hypothetical protein n=1 Tax=Streptomyces sp. RK9 TaxID=3239284 RepID=UPI00386A701F
MRDRAERGERSGQAARASATARQGSPRQTATSSQHARFLALHPKAGNAALSRAVAVQRASGRDGGSSSSSRSTSPDADLAYGSDHERPPRGRGADRRSDDDALAYGEFHNEGPYSGTVGGVSFQTERDGGLMKEVRDFVARVSPHFQEELAAAGSVTVRFGRADGGGVGVWKPDSRTVVLNHLQADVRRAGPGRLFGAAVFELLNASKQRRRARLDHQVKSGEFDRLAEREGLPPEKYYGRKVEYIEWKNVVIHRRVMKDARLKGSVADMFSAEPGDFESYYKRQVEGRHTHGYEFYYNLLRTQARARAERGEPGSSTPTSPSSSDSE